MQTTKIKSALYGLWTGVVGGIGSLLLINFWESNFPANSGYIVLPLVSVVIVLAIYLAIGKFETVQQKILNVFLAGIAHLAVLYVILISAMMFAFSNVKY